MSEQQCQTCGNIDYCNHRFYESDFRSAFSNDVAKQVAADYANMRLPRIIETMRADNAALRKVLVECGEALAMANDTLIEVDRVHGASPMTLEYVQSALNLIEQTLSKGKTE